MSDIEQALRAPNPKKTYPVKPEAQQKARRSAARAAGARIGRHYPGAQNGYVSSKGKEYDQRALRCKCERAWNGGEGRCLTCGKRL